MVEHQLPNKAYNAKTGGMTNGANRPGPIGWSAVDLGRLLIWLRITADDHPWLSEYIDKVVLRWNFCELIDENGELRGAVLRGGRVHYYQEGRLGYEEYAAYGFRAWGLEPERAAKIDPMMIRQIEGVNVPVDSRDGRETGIPAPLVSMPFLLLGLEFNWDEIGSSGFVDSIHTDSEHAAIAEAIYEVQEARYERRRIFTARTDHPLSEPPYFVFDSIYASGYAWNTVSDDGDHYPHLALVATRAAFPLWALWRTEYTDELIKVVSPLFDEKQGWYEGRYELTGGYEYAVSSTTNAVVLESIRHKLEGKAFRDDAPYRHWIFQLTQEFEDPGLCRPMKPSAVK